MRLLPLEGQRSLWMLALDRFHVDLVLERWVVEPVLAVARAVDRVERALARPLDSGESESP